MAGSPNRRAGQVRRWGLPLLCAAVALLACARLPVDAPPIKPKPSLMLERTGFDRLPGWNGAQAAAALPAFLRSCAKFAVQPAKRSLGAGGVAGRMADWRDVCAAAKILPKQNATAIRAFFETRFRPYHAKNGSDKGLFTGYYEPLLRGARQRQGAYQVPIFARPNDLVMVDLGAFRKNMASKRIAGRVKNGRLVPFDDRATIGKGSLNKQGLELVWVDDPVAAFFLQIQGSGRIALPNGQQMRLGYDGHNGHVYTSIGRVLIKRGHLTKAEVSLQTIAAWLRANPIEGKAVMDANRAFVFFRELKGTAGPVGAQGVALTPEQSLAVDRRFIPLGVPLWLDTTDPDDGKTPLRRLVVAQDTGGAIKGPVRGDLFWGYGARAEHKAGRMKQPGSYYVLLPAHLNPMDR